MEISPMKEEILQDVIRASNNLMNTPRPFFHRCTPHIKLTFENTMKQSSF